MAKKTKILLIYTGGTIGMMKDSKTGSLIPFDFDNIVERIPELNLLDCSIETISFDDPIDSSEMNPKYWVQIAEIIEENYLNKDGFVILHGSDTMSYSASALSFILENLRKPVVFTGSQLPIGDLRTDAKENLITSIQIAALQRKGKPIVKEVCLYFEYKLYRANRTTKISAEHFEAFTSLNYPELLESGVHLKVNEQFLLKPEGKKKLRVHKSLCKDIALIKLFPGIPQSVIHNILQTPNLKGVIIESFGAGNTSTDNSFLSLLKSAIKNGIPVINVTQCSGGSVLMGKYESSATLKKIGVISGKDITTEAALTKLMFLMGLKKPPKDLKRLFQTSLRGEIT